MNRSNKNDDDLFLPDFCAIRMVFVVVIIAELAAFVLALAPLDTPAAERWHNLGLISFYVQWCALASSAVLCLTRPLLRGLSHVQVSLISFTIILTVIALISEGAYRFFYTPIFGANTDWHLHFVLRNLAIGAIISGPLLRYFYVQHQWRRKLKTETEARLQALQSRIRPHFLFNSMNTIASLTRNQPQQAETAVENLADLFRVSLSEAHKHISLEKEFELCRRYLQIESLRLGERLVVNWNIDAVPADAQVPPLLLQPLLENAVYHGIEPLTEGGEVAIKGWLDKEVVHLEINNPLPAPNPNSQRNGNRIAQDNIRERLAAIYGAKAGLNTHAEANRYQTEVFFPYVTRRNENSDRG